MIDFAKYMIAEEKTGILDSNNSAVNYFSGYFTEAHKEVFNETKQKSIQLIVGQRFTEDNRRRIIDTKIGGIPYWPNDMEYPNHNGIPMIMVAQLNFGKLPHLPGFPTKGLLQFFILGDGSFGAFVKGGYRVVYHEKISSVNLKSNFEVTTLDIHPKMIGKSSVIDDSFPIEGVYYPEAKIEVVGVNPTCDEFNTRYLAKLNAKLNTKWNSILDIPDYLSDQYFEFNYKQAAGCRIGGYPYFVQNDEKNNPEDILLLQLDSEGEMMWGDVGSAQFMISPRALKQKKFNEVYYTWACG